VNLFHSSSAFIRALWDLLVSKATLDGGACKGDASKLSIPLKNPGFSESLGYNMDNVSNGKDS
jgi:hypothetical protein